MKAPAIFQIGLLEESERLRRVALLASSFFIEDNMLRIRYLKEIDDFINSSQRRMRVSDSFDEQKRILGELSQEREETEKTYQKLRVGDYVKYIVTDIFEDQGVLKYAKVAAGVAGGGLQVFAGGGLFQVGRKLHVKRFQAIGLTLVAHGGNNVFEAFSPIFYDGVYKPGVLRKLYRYFASLSGGNTDSGDLMYSIGDLSFTAYAAFRVPVLIENPNRLVTKGLFDRPRTNRLFNYINKDYERKYTASSAAMKLYLWGSASGKTYIKLNDENYIYNDR